MFVFRNLMVIVLISIIGNQERLLANAADPGEHVETQTIEETGGNGKSATTKAAKQMWQCQPGSDHLQKQLALTTSLMKGGEKVLHQLHQHLPPTAVSDETVLLLGKAGSGKTSLVQFLTRNAKVQSIKVRSDTGEYVLDDGERIGTSATESFTLYPEIVSYNHQDQLITLCDSPGFHDSRSSAHEIVSMDIMKSLAGRFKKVKILLLEHHGSLQYGGLKDTFMNTLHHFTDFLTDIDRYRDHIALIATKIPFTYKMADEGDLPELITEQMHIESVIEYLNHTEASIAEKIFTEDIGQNEKDFYQKVIKLLQSLQTRDENGKATRINVFRRPHKSGPLVDMPLLDKNWESLTKTIMHLKAVDVKPNDFDFTLSSEAKMYLECLQKLTSDNFNSLMNELSYKLIEFVDVKVQNHASFHQLVADLQSLHDALVELTLNIDGIVHHNEFFEKINNFIITSQKIPLRSFNEGMDAMKKYERVLSKFSNTHEASISSSWLPAMRRVIRVIQDELEWYKSLNKFIEGLSSYNIQKNKSEIYSALFHEGRPMASTDGLLTLFTQTTGSTDTKFNTRKRLEIETIPETLLGQNNVTCDADGTLIVQGFHIVLSEIDGLVRSYCRKIKVKGVVLLAVDTVFLDEDTSDGWRGVDLTVAAPRWQVIGQRTIDLSGQPGAEIPGFPGKPGSNGGSFQGIGIQFLNGGNLRVYLGGGDGGSGAKGVNGPPGAAGRDAEDILRSGGYGVADSTYRFDRGVPRHDLTYSLGYSGSDEVFILLKTESKFFTWNVSTEVEVVIKDGECGGAGGEGGAGWAGGVGGFAGDHQLIELRGRSHIILQNNTGTRGKPGPEGDTGPRGQDGIGMICVKIEGFDYGDKVTKLSREYWKCKPTKPPACHSSCLERKQSKDHIEDGIEHPPPKKSPDFRHHLKNYARLLNRHSNNAIFQNTISDFKEAFYKKFSYNLYTFGIDRIQL